MQSAPIVADDSPTYGLDVTTGGDLNPRLAPLPERLSWALYDFANTVFSMNIATLYFSAWLVKDLGHSNTLYATVNGIASALVVVSERNAVPELTTDTFAPGTTAPVLSVTAPTNVAAPV